MLKFEGWRRAHDLSDLVYERETRGTKWVRERIVIWNVAGPLGIKFSVSRWQDLEPALVVFGEAPTLETAWIAAVECAAEMLAVSQAELMVGG